MTREEDGELMRRYSGGDMGAFETLYRRHRSALFRYLSRQARDTELASDLFQEVWIKVVANRNRYEPRAKFSTFLYRIAHNCFIDHCRRAATRHARAHVSDAEMQSSLAAPSAETPEARLEQAQTQASYRAALATLPADQRDTFLLYEESGLSLEDIALITGVGAETAKSRLRYAVAKLRAALNAVPEHPALEEPGT